MSAHDDFRARRAVPVWDLVVRLFHWSTVVLFAAAYLIERPRDLHEALGYLLLTVLAVRVVWGFVGTQHARFTDFVPAPGALARYLRDLAAGRERRYLGHNPAGGAMVVALMLTLAATGTTGWMMGLDAFWGQDWVEDLHEGLATFAVLLIAIHVVGVIYESLRHGENLVRAMITGKKSID